MKKAIRVIFLLWILGFIFFMSSRNGFESHRYNEELVRFLKDITAINLYDLYDKVYVDIIIRKLGHFFEFSCLSAAAYSVFCIFKVRWATILTIGVCIVFAFADELHQLYVLDRTSSYVDVIIDSMGIMMTIGTISLFRIIKYELSSERDNNTLWNNRSNL